MITALLIVRQFENLVNLYGCKAKQLDLYMHLLFENLANLYGCKATIASALTNSKFENLVNLYGCKATATHRVLIPRFENLVNSYGYKAHTPGLNIQRQFSMDDLKLLTIGLIHDMYAEGRNDEFSYAEIASQQRFNQF